MGSPGSAGASSMCEGLAYNGNLQTIKATYGIRRFFTLSTILLLDIYSAK